jgi:hypothetical protein
VPEGDGLYQLAAVVGGGCTHEAHAEVAEEHLAVELAAIRVIGVRAVLEARPRHAQPGGLGVGVVEDEPVIVGARPVDERVDEATAVALGARSLGGRPAQVLARLGDQVDLLGGVGADVTDPVTALGVADALPRRPQAVGVDVRAVGSAPGERVAGGGRVPGAADLAIRNDSDQRAKVRCAVLRGGVHRLVAEQRPQRAIVVEADGADVVPRLAGVGVAEDQDLRHRSGDGVVVGGIEGEPEDAAVRTAHAGADVQEAVFGEVRIEGQRDEATVEDGVDAGHLEGAEALGGVALQAIVHHAAAPAERQQLVGAGQELHRADQPEVALDGQILEGEAEDAPAAHAAALGRCGAILRVVAAASREGGEQRQGGGCQCGSDSIHVRSNSTAAASRRSTPSGGIALISGSVPSPEKARKRMLSSGAPGTTRIPAALALLSVG